MIFHSVVGKLWITIVIFVSIIFLFLSISLIEYFDHYYYEEQSNALIRVGDKVANILKDYPDEETAISTAEEVVSTIDAQMIFANKDKSGNFIPVDQIFTSEELEELYNDSFNVYRFNDPSYTDFITFNSSNDILALAVPFNNNDDSAVIIYLTLENLYETTSDIKKIILLFAGIGVLVTTFFSFFLSSRITAPVREMQEAVNEIAKGDFHRSVNVKTSDEIGELGKSFNLMAKQLDETVQALSTEKDKVANILKSMADGLVTFNTHGEILLTNPPAEQMLYSWKTKEYRLPNAMREMLKQFYADPKIIEEDIQISGRIFAVKMTPLFSGKEVKGVVTLLRDVTNERKLNKLRKDFLANVSHELRTPISMLQGYSEAIIDDVAETPEEKKELAKIIYDESLRMGRLVNELLDIAKMESGTLPLNYCNVDVKNVMNKMINKFAKLSSESNLIFTGEIDEELNEVEIDADRIEQVLTNLIDNAIRHTPTGGQIILRAKKNANNTMLLEVEDSGVGIPEEDIPFVFERFYKADKARTRGHSGTGLGLSIVKNIVIAHKGTISVSSKLGHGTIFSIILPMTKEE